MQKKRIYTNTGCPIHGTKYCTALNMQSCEKCTFSKEYVDTVRQDIDAIEKLIPEDGMGKFYSSGRCMLCKGEKRRAKWFGTVDIGNPDPPKTGRSVLGLKTDLSAGSMLTLQLSCCDECRKNHAALSGVENIITLIVGVVMIGALNVTGIYESVAAIAGFMPILLFALVVGGTWLCGRVYRKKQQQRIEQETYLRVFDIPGVDELKSKGWFEINPYKGMSKLIFSREPLKQGLFTGAEIAEEPAAQEA